MAYDPACEELATYFLSEGGDKPADKEKVAVLAQHIQTTIEDWLEYDAKPKVEVL